MEVIRGRERICGARSGRRTSRQISLWAAFLDHERAKTELKGLMPEDAREAFGHGVRAKRSKSGAVSFEMIEAEAGHASVQ
jgi:hypothetical protein